MYHQAKTPDRSINVEVLKDSTIPHGGRFCWRRYSQRCHIEHTASNFASSFLEMQKLKSIPLSLPPPLTSFVRIFPADIFFFFYVTQWFNTTAFQLHDFVRVLTFQITCNFLLATIVLGILKHNQAGKALLPSHIVDIISRKYLVDLKIIHVL